MARRTESFAIAPKTYGILCYVLRLLLFTLVYRLIPEKNLKLRKTLASTRSKRVMGC